MAIRFRLVRWCWPGIQLATAATLLLSLASRANAEGKLYKPSFSCEKAALPAEKAICKNEVLSMLDNRLALVWRGYSSDFREESSAGVLKKEQAAWRAKRDQCQADVVCIDRHYRQRLDQLSGRSDKQPLAGRYTSKEGASMTLYPKADGNYIVYAVHSAPDARWVCSVDNVAIADGNRATITADEVLLVVEAGGKDTLVVNEGTGVSHWCGMGGSLAGVYARQLVD
jgi:uncharacterized protein